MLSIAEYMQISKESDECSAKQGVEQNPDTTLNKNPKAIINNTKNQIKDSVSGKELEGQELDPNMTIEFNTIDEPAKTGKGLKGGDEKHIEEVCQEADNISKRVDELVSIRNKINGEIIALEEEIPAQLKQLDNPESVTTADVVVASESLKYKLKYLDIPLQNSKAMNVISKESMVNNPAADLMVCVEDEKTLLGKLKEKAAAVWEWICKQFRKLVDFLSSILSKLPGFKSKEKAELDKLAKQADELTDEEINKSLKDTIKDIKVDPEKWRNFNIGSLYILKGGDINAFTARMTELNVSVSRIITDGIFNKDKNTDQELDKLLEEKHKLISDYLNTCGILSLAERQIDKSKYYYFDFLINQFSGAVVIINLVLKPSLWKDGEKMSELTNDQKTVSIDFVTGIDENLISVKELRDLAKENSNYHKQIDQLEKWTKRIKEGIEEILKNGLKVSKDVEDAARRIRESGERADEAIQEYKAANKRMEEIMGHVSKSSAKNSTRNIKAITSTRKFIGDVIDVEVIEDDEDKKEDKK